MKYSHPLFFLLLSLPLLSCAQSPPKTWTIMHYAAGSNSSEMELLNDVAEMKAGKRSDDYNLVLLIDRVEGHSEDSLVLGQNFTDTRLYAIHPDASERLDGREILPDIGLQTEYDANMGDAKTLKSFIRYCKKYYPADHYLLILRSHGNGVSMCPDAESGIPDRLYPGELSAVLGEEESVDILGLDVCSMAGLENLYEWRPGSNRFSADYVIASAPLSGAWAYDEILGRFSEAPSEAGDVEKNHFDDAVKRNHSPLTTSPQGLAKLIIEEVYANQRWSSWGLFDNRQITRVKTWIDEAAKILAVEDRQAVLTIIDRSITYHHQMNNDQEIARLTIPYLDAHHFWQQISRHERLSGAAREKAVQVLDALDQLVMHSYYGRGFLPETEDFTPGKGGVYQIIPSGNLIFSQSGRTFWSHTSWFHPDDLSEGENTYGQYDWCADGAVRSDGKVDNFFEFLDFLFDDENDESGGVNGYRW